MSENTKTFVGHRTDIRTSDGKINATRHFRCHIANGAKYFSEPPHHDKFYTEQGISIPYEDVPDVCKRHLVTGKNDEQVKPDVKPVLHKVESKSKKIEGSKPAAGDSLI